MENIAVWIKKVRDELGQIAATMEASGTSVREVTVAAGMIVSENGHFIVHASGRCWACLMSKKECGFMRALIQTGGKMDGNDAEKLVGSTLDRKIRNFVGAANKKLRTKKMPVLLHFSKWIIWIEMRIA